MPIFKEIQASGQAIFKNEVALDPTYIPKVIPYRETQQRYIAACIKPLMEKRNGKNLVIYGPPGVGKTVAVKHLFQELEEETDEVIPIHINCWTSNTSYKIVVEMCNALDYKFIQNKKTEELFEVIKQIFNKKSVVFAFDEIDKVQDLDFLYMILESVYRKTILMITNYRSSVDEFDERIKSRLTAELLEFKPYTDIETKGILRKRVESAFATNAVDPDAFNLIGDKAFRLQDIRPGLYLLRESALIADNSGSKKITIDHARESIKKLDEFHIKNSADLAEDEQLILSIIKQNSGKKTGELYKVFQDQGGLMSYKTFHRKIARLHESKFISLEKIEGGKEGNTTIVEYAGKAKKLTDF